MSQATILSSPILTDACLCLSKSVQSEAPHFEIVPCALSPKDSLGSHTFAKTQQARWRKIPPRPDTANPSRCWSLSETHVWRIQHPPPPRTEALRQQGRSQGLVRGRQSPESLGIQKLVQGAASSQRSEFCYSVCTCVADKRRGRVLLGVHTGPWNSRLKFCTEWRGGGTCRAVDS